MLSAWVLRKTFLWARNKLNVNAYLSYKHAESSWDCDNTKLYRPSDGESTNLYEATRPNITTDPFCIIMKWEIDENLNLFLSTLKIYSQQNSRTISSIRREEQFLFFVLKFETCDAIGEHITTQCQVDRDGEKFLKERKTDGKKWTLWKMNESSNGHVLNIIEKSLILHRIRQQYNQKCGLNFVFIQPKYLVSYFNIIIWLALSMCSVFCSRKYSHNFDQICCIERMKQALFNCSIYQIEFYCWLIYYTIQTNGNRWASAYDFKNETI